MIFTCHGISNIFMPRKNLAYSVNKFNIFKTKTICGVSSHQTSSVESGQATNLAGKDLSDKTRVINIFSKINTFSRSIKVDDHKTLSSYLLQRRL